MDALYLGRVQHEPREYGQCKTLPEGAAFVNRETLVCQQIRPRGTATRAIPAASQKSPLVQDNYYGTKNYSNAEDFADDWEDDFEDYDDAYDYYEEVTGHY